MKHSIEQWLTYKDMMYRIATEYSRKYPMVEPDDLQQEMYMWFVTHPRKFKEWMELDMKDSDKLIAKSLRNQCLKFCQKEKARTAGYDVEDLYYYDASVVETFLPSVITESYEMPAKIKDLGNQVKSGEISDGMNWLGLRSDIAKAYYKLSETKQAILKVRFSFDVPDWNIIADMLQTTPDGARMKVQRIITNIIQYLGGWKPHHDEDTTIQETESSFEEVDE